MGLFGTKTSVQQVQKRDKQPEELNTLAQGLYNKIYPGLQNFNANQFTQAQNVANNALQQQSNLISQLPSTLSQNNSLINEMLDVVRTGNVPSALTDSMNAAVNKELQGSMGSMLNSLAGRGVLNSSITGQGVSRLGQQAADAYNRNYLTAYNTVLGGYGQALQGTQGNTQAALAALSALGQVPSQAYENTYAGLMPAFNFWKTWQSLENSKPEEYDTVVTEKSSSCITGDTLVTLPDGEEIPVSELDDDDEILAWDFENGCVTSAPLAVLFRGFFPSGRDIIRVEFENGTSVGVIFEHLFFDMTLGKFIAINSDSQEYVGHEIAKVNKEGSVIPVRVVKIYNDGKTTNTYAPQSEGHLNFLASGFISGNDGQLGLCNMFDFDTDKMRYHPDRKEADLLKYGKLAYEELSDVMSEEFFISNHCDEFSVAIEKGLIGKDELKSYLMEFSNCFLK